MPRRGISKSTTTSTTGGEQRRVTVYFQSSLRLPADSSRVLGNGTGTDRWRRTDRWASPSIFLAVTRYDFTGGEREAATNSLWRQRERERDGERATEIKDARMHESEMASEGTWRGRVDLGGVNNVGRRPIFREIPLILVALSHFELTIWRHRRRCCARCTLRRIVLCDSSWWRI